MLRNISIAFLSLMLLSCSESQFTGSRKGLTSQNGNPNTPIGGISNIQNPNKDNPFFDPNNPSLNPGDPNFTPGNPNFTPGNPSLNPGDPNFTPGNPNFTPGNPNFTPGNPNFNPDSSHPEVIGSTSGTVECRDHVTFASSTWMRGNEVNPGGDAQLSGADNICTSLARKAKLCPTKTFKAILSSGSVDAKDRIQISGPVFNNAPTRQLVVSNEGQFWEKNGWQSLIVFDEYKRAIPKGHPSISQKNYVWTGSNVNGTRRRNQNCKNFNSLSGLGGAGSYYERDDVLFDGTWGARKCSEVKKIYCISN